MLVQPTEDEGEGSERTSEPQPIPSTPHPSTDQHETQTNPSPRPSPTSYIPDSIPEGSGGNHEGQSSSDKSLSGNEGGMTLQSVYDLCISLCTQSLDEECIHEAKIGRKEILKEIRKSAKAEPSVHKDPAFDELDDDEIDYMETEDAQHVGRIRYVVHEEKESAEKEVSTEDALSTDKQKVSTDKEEVSTDRPNEGTDKQKVSTNKEEVSTDRPDEGTDKEKDSTDKEKDSTDRPDEGTVDQTEGRSATPTTPTPTPTTFGDDETIAQVLLNMSQAKAVSREKEKGVELKDVENIERPRPTSTRSLLTLKPLPKIDPKDKGKKKIEEDESDTESEDINETKKKFKMLAHDEEIARKMQEDWEAEAERKRLAEEEATNDALIQYFDDIKARIEADRLLALWLQEEEREQFTMEERAKFLHDTITAQRRFLAEQRAVAIRNRPPTRTQLRKTTKKEDTVKVPAKVDVTEQGTKKRKGGHMKMIARKRKRPQLDVDSEDEHRKCLKITTFEVNGNFRAFNYLLEVLHIFDRQDLFYLYDLVMKQYSEVTLEGFELILWGDLKIMMESSTEENDHSDFWNNQQNLEIVRWRLYEACGVYILELEDGTVIHMFVEEGILSPRICYKGCLI
ncbi:hypothetical protein Tco_0250559 [Tanacetum coccineum]